MIRKDLLNDSKKPETLNEMEYEVSKKNSK